MIILPAKRVVDIVPLRADFSAVMQPGDSIDTFDVQVFVFSGVDSVGSLTVDTVDLIPPDVIVAHLKAGLPGVVYLIQISVVTVDGLEFSQEAQLAILKDAFPAGPLYQNLWLTSRPYPLFFTESFGLYAEPLEGNTHQTLFELDAPLLNLSLGIAPVGGDLRSIVRSYTIPPEEISLELSPQTGQLRQLVVPTAPQIEEFILELEPRSGELRQIVIQYTIDPEPIEITLAPLSGTLS